MILSNLKIDYSTVLRMPNVKISGQMQGTTINTKPASTSLQDISSHHTQKFTWNNNNNKDQQLVNFSEQILSSNTGRQLSISHSDKRIFEHPEVTIIPSALDDELQRRLLTIKTSNPSEQIPERDGGQSVPNILEHPDMRSPIVMQPQPLSSSLSTSLTYNECKQVSRTRSADIYSTMVRTPSPFHRVDFFLDDVENSKLSSSPGSPIGDIIECSEQDKNDDPSSSTTKDSIQIYSKSAINSLTAKTNNSW